MDKNENTSGVKRPRTDNADDTFTIKPLPLFLIIHGENKDLSKVSPFLIQKALLGIAGTLKSVKKLRSGDLLVETSNQAQTKSLLSSKMLADIPISVLPHNTLNSSRGVISESDLLYVTESELREELEDQGVTDVRRITMKKDGQQVPTKHLIITFNTPKLPTEIKAGYLNCPVRHYIPNPLRCFRCQKYGHSKISCRGSATCAKCGGADHEADTCTSTPCCVNCKGEHPAYARSCPKWKEEKEIQRIKTTENISYPEARKRVTPILPRVGISYAAATSKSFTSIAVQTDLSFSPSIKLPSVQQSTKTTTSTQSTSVLRSTPPVNNPKPSTSNQQRASTTYNPRPPYHPVRGKGHSRRQQRNMQRQNIAPINTNNTPNSCSEHSSYEDEEMEVESVVKEVQRKVVLKRDTPLSTSKPKT